MNRRSLLLVPILLLIACDLGSIAAPIRVLPSPTPAPTLTASPVPPTFTLTPTFTNTITLTSTLTFTPTETFTSLPTFTPTATLLRPALGEERPIKPPVGETHSSRNGFFDALARLRSGLGPKISS